MEQEIELLVENVEQLSRRVQFIHESLGTAAIVEQFIDLISTTLEGPLDWPDATLARGDAIDIVTRLKAASAIPLRSHGSLSLNRTLMAAGLVLFLMTLATNMIASIVVASSEVSAAESSSAPSQVVVRRLIRAWRSSSRATTPRPKLEWLEPR